MSSRRDFHPSDIHQGSGFDESDEDVINDEVMQRVVILQNLRPAGDESDHDMFDMSSNSSQSSDYDFQIADDNEMDSDFSGPEYASDDNPDDYRGQPETEEDDSNDSAIDEDKKEETTLRRAIDDYDENEEEDEVVRSIIAEIKKPRTRPPDIKTEDFVVDLSFHPEQDILAVGSITGDVLIYKFANEENTLLKTLEVHTKAVRDIEFSIDGKQLFSTSRDKSIMISDVETGKLVRFWDKAHEEPVYCLSVLGENLFATGDDNGWLKLWDLRQKDVAPVFSLKEVDDNITSIISNEAKRYLLMTSGDGYLTTINIPAKKLYVQSEPYEEEFTCMGVYRNDSKVVVGSSKGNFYTFNWGQFGYHCDAFAGPSGPINKMIPITDRVAITGGEDGIIRAMHLVPGRTLGIVGQHSLAVEAMDICANGEYIASSSHDNDIRFWNVKYFEEFAEIDYHSKANNKRCAVHNLPSSKYSNTRDFFADMA